MRGTGNRDFHNDFGQEKENVKREAFSLLKILNETREECRISASAG